MPFESVWDKLENKITHNVLPSISEALKHDVLPNVKAAVVDAATTGLTTLEHEVSVGLVEGKKLRDTLYEAAYAGAAKAKDRIVKRIYHDVDLPFLEIDKEDMPNKTDKAKDIRLEMKVDGRQREYLVHVPPGYDRNKPMPLVVVLHGIQENDKDIAALSQMSQKADKEGFIVAYPNATKWLGTNTWQAWDTKNGISPPGTSSDDVGFVGKMIDSISNQMGVDKSRVYVTGFSNGGMLTHRIATELSDKVAAVAIVGGAMSGNEKQPSSPVSVMTINGTADCVVPYDGLASCENLQKIGIPKFTSSAYAFDFWKQAYGGKSDIETTETNSNVKMHRVVNPETNVEIVSYLLEGGKHEWPGSDRAKKTPDQTDAKFSATDAIWEFFLHHSKKGSK